MNSQLAVKQLKQIEKFIPKERKSMRLAADWNEKWQILISTILSAQTRDEQTIKFSNILYKKFPSSARLANAELSEIKKIIRPINYHKTKAKHIKETAKIISQHGIPTTLEGLLELPGVGRKVANVYLAAAHKRAAIGVDTHVAFISRLLGWTSNKNPHKIEKDLELLFPKQYWNSINYILVRFGRCYSRKRQEEIINELLQETNFY